MNAPKPMTPQTRACADCGTPLPQDAPEGLCPQCSLRNALGSVGPEQNGQVGVTTVITKPLEADDGTLPRFGDYELLEEIARGGMGVVYKARQISLDRVVAVKMLLFGSLASKDFVQRFRIEASAAASLQHPNIVAVHEVGVHQNQHYLVMDYIPGQTLSKLSGGQPLPPGRAAAYVKAIAEAVHFAHEHNVLHRDLKPSNVLIDPNDQPHVTDFGLAKRLDAEMDLTLSGQVLGSPNYMSPEQASGKRGKVGRHSDIYSLGAILFHLLTGRPPFVAESVQETIQLVLEREPITPRTLVAGLPRDLETICLKCLQKEPAKRYATAKALAEDLGHFLNDEPIQARRVNMPEKVWRWCRRNPRVASLSAATLLLLLAVVIGSPFAIYRIDSERKRAEEKAFEAQRNVYASDMTLAAQALASTNFGRAVELVEKYEARDKSELRNPRSEIGMRGWEWRYLWQQTHSDELFTLGDESNATIWRVAFSPKGRFLASADQDGQIRIWDFNERRLVGTYSHSAEWLAAMAFSRDERLLATAYSDGEGVVKFWDLQTMRALQPLQVSTNGPRYIAFLPDNKSLLVVSHPGLSESLFADLRIWDLTTRLPGASQQLPDREGHCLLSPDGRTLAIGRDDGKVVLWDIHAGRPVKTLTGHADRSFPQAFSWDGQTLASADNHNAIKIWGVSSGVEKTTLTNLNFPFLRCIDFSLDGKVLAAGDMEQKIKLWSTETWEELATLRGHRARVFGVTFDPNGQTLAGAVERIRVWNAKPKRALPSRLEISADHYDFNVEGYRRSKFVLSQDGKAFMFVNKADVVIVGETATLQIMNQVPLPITNIGAAAALSVGGRLVAFGTADGTVNVWDCFGKTNVATFRFAHEFLVLEFSPDGKLLAGAAGWDPKIVRRPGQLVLWDLQTTREIARSQMGHLPGAIRFSPDGQVLAAVSGVTVTLRERANLKQIGRALKGHRSSAEAVTFSPNGQTLATTGRDQRVRLWNVATQQSVEPPLRMAWISARSAAFSPDGHRLAVLGDGSVTIYDIASHHEVATLKGHPSGGADIFFLDDDTLVTTADNEMLLWRAAPVSEIVAHERAKVERRTEQ